MKIRLILGAAALALAACGSSGGDKGGEGGNGSAAATGSGASGGSGGSASGVNLQPGEWEMKMEVVNVKVEGLPPGLAENMKSQSGGINRTCMTPEEAKAPKGDIFAGDKSNNCNSEGFKWEGGRIEGKTTCSGQGGTGQTVMTMDGKYSAQSIDMTMKSETDMMGKPMTMEMRVSGKRVGECTAATKKG
ncbi:MAG TPA: DUF3617 domain-containing protein [Allosphingosinicella sp.]|jgi:hypothetical protein